MTSLVLVFLSYVISAVFSGTISPTFSNSTHEIYAANVSWSNDVINCGKQNCQIECLAESICDNLQINPSSFSESVSLTCSKLACNALKIMQSFTHVADISCIGEASCYNSRFVLTNTPTINLLCGDSGSGLSGKGSCQYSQLFATNAMDVNIICSGSGQHMCRFSVFHLQYVSNVATITANGYRALSQSGSHIVSKWWDNWPGSDGIMAHNANRLIINCMSSDACYDNVIYPPYQSQYAFSLKCTDQNFACGTPASSSFTYILVNNSNFVTNFLDLYCAQFTSTSSCWIRIYCRYEELYTQMQYSNSNMRYQCADSDCCPWQNYDFISKKPTQNPTSAPIIIITNNPTESPIATTLVTFTNTTYSQSPIVENTIVSIASSTNENEESKQSNSLMIVSVVCAFTFLVSIIIILCCLYAKKMRNTKSGESKEIIIQNALVIFLAIGEYENNPTDPDVQLQYGHLPDLAIDQDIVNLSLLFGKQNLNYTIYPKYDLNTSPAPKIQWTQHEIVTLLTEKANFLEENINTFDGLFVAISSHGIKDHICCSDYKIIEKLAVHRIFSQNHPKSREIPRIFCFDCCDGNAEQSKNIKIKKATATEEKEKEESGDHTYQSKNYTVDQIEKLHSEVWKRDTKNPDYRLVEINAANPGFQSKLSNVIGSYMLHGFVEKMIDDLNNNKNQYIHQIFDDIQNELQEKGKQLTKNTYNNNTRYIKLKRNNNSATNDTIDQVNSIEITTIHNHV